MRSFDYSHFEVVLGDRIKAKSETDRTPDEQARLKLHQDEVWEASRRFDYDDQWDDDQEERD